MSEGNSIINLGDLSKPANTLIEKIAEAIGGVFEPWQIERLATAEAKAAEIKAVSKIEISQIEQRALDRFLYEEAKNQDNIESITAKSLAQLNADAKPEEIEEDWIVNFFDKCRLISDEEMQDVWARILAGESNAPGRFSKRTINFMESLDKGDAQLFTKLCAFNWIIDGTTHSLVYELKDDIYKQNGVHFGGLKHLDAIGLISFESIAGYKKMGISKTSIAMYKNISYSLEFKKDKDNDINLGKVILTNIGKELSSICMPDLILGFDIYTIDQWKKERIKVSKVTQQK